jgi:uncharacterized repeat protein (TIGR01451 family)
MIMNKLRTKLSVSFLSAGLILSSVTCLLVPFRQAQADSASLSISKLVRNLSTGVGFSKSVVAQNGERVAFQISIMANNGTVDSALLTENLPTGLKYISGTGKLDTVLLSDTFAFSSLSLGPITSGKSKVLSYEAYVSVQPGLSQASLTNIATVSGIGAASVSDSAAVNVNQNVNPPVDNNVLPPASSANLTFSQRAFNETKNVDATIVDAQKEDYVTYTLTVTNSGGLPALNFSLSDDLSQILPYADLADNGNGNFSGKVLMFPNLTVPSAGSISKSFQVRVKYFLPDSQNFSMSNTFGNTLTVNISNPQVKGAFVAPKTGADTMGLMFGGLLTLGFALYRHRKYLIKLIFT